MLWRLKRENQRWRIYARMLIDENRWRAQRYGTDQGLVDFGRGAIFPYAELLDEMIAPRRSGCASFRLPRRGGAHARESSAGGPARIRQLAVYERALFPTERQHAAALAAVVDWLIAENRARTLADQSGEPGGKEGPPLFEVRGEAPP